MSRRYLRERLRHPEWWPRLIRNATRTRYLWLRQGRPRDAPVVVKPGRLIATPDGHGTITGWHFDGRHQTRAVTVDDLWDRLSAMYPVERP